MKKNFFMAVLFCMVAANVSFAGNVKVLSTNAVNVDYDMQSNLYVLMDVKIETANIGREECGVMMIMDNRNWANNMNFEKFLDLMDIRCYGEAYLPVIGATTTRRTVRVTVPLETKKLTGEGETFYAKVYVYNTKLNKCVGEGVPVKFDIDFNAVKERMMKDAVDIVGGAILLGGLISWF